MAAELEGSLAELLPNAEYRLPGASASVLAVSGGNLGAHGKVTGHHLEEFCEEEEDEFCDAYRDLLHWWFLEADNIGSQAWAAEIVRRFQEMRPLAPAAQVGAMPSKK